MKFSGLVLSTLLPRQSQDTSRAFSLTQTPIRPKVRLPGQSSLRSSVAVVLGWGRGRKALKGRGAWRRAPI